MWIELHVYMIGGNNNRPQRILFIVPARYA